jgi:hypothetical protein
VTKQDRVFGVKPQIVFLVIVLILLIPSGFFTLKSFNQLEDVLGIIETPVSAVAVPIIEKDEDPEVWKSRVLAELEKHVIGQRHAQVRAMLATRTWLRFMSLIFGAIMVVIGASFAIARVSGQLSTAEAGTGDWKIAFSTSSPGLMLAFLGAILIVVPNVSKQRIEFSDQAVYISAVQTVAVSPGVDGVARGDRSVEYLAREAYEAQFGQPAGHEDPGPGEDDGANGVEESEQ